MPHCNSTFFRFLTIHFCKLSFPIVLHQTGSCDLRSLSLFPALEVIQPFLAHLKESSFHLIQASHQRRRVLVVGVLGGVHDAAETGNERLRRTTESLAGYTEPPPAQTCRPELSKLKSQRFRLLFTTSQGSTTSTAPVKLGYKDKTTSCLRWTANA